MRVLHVIDSGGLYGAELMLLTLVEEQIHHNLKALIASIGTPEVKEKPLEVEATKRNIPIRLFRMRPGPNYLGILQILSYAESENFDLLHTHGYKSNILLGFLPSWFRKMPLVSTVHGWTATTGNSKMKLYEYIDRLSLRFADSVVLVNKEMLKHPYLKNNTLKHIRVIDNGIKEHPLYHSTYRKDIHNFCEGHKVVGAIGRLSEEKGFVYLIEAFGKISKLMKNVRLLILGEGPHRKHLQKAITQLEDPCLVYMPGFVEDANRYLNLLDVLAIPSLTEGLPLTLLEAMREGVPVVASNVGGIPDVLDNGRFGILVPPRDAKILTGALMEVLGLESNSNILANRGVKHFHQNYTSANMCIKYLRLYQDILNTHRIVNA